MADERTITLTMTELEELCLDAADEVVYLCDSHFDRECARPDVRKVIGEWLDSWMTQKGSNA